MASALLSKSKEAVTEALEKATAAMSVGENEKENQGEGPQAGQSKGGRKDTTTTPAEGE